MRQSQTCDVKGIEAVLHILCLPGYSGACQRQSSLRKHTMKMRNVRRDIEIGHSDLAIASGYEVKLRRHQQRSATFLNIMKSYTILNYFIVSVQL